MVETKPSERDIQNYAKKLLEESDKQIQLMYGRNIRLFDTQDMRKHLSNLTNQLRDHDIKPKQLKITPATLKFFNRGFDMGMAMAHYKHTTNGKVNIREFALKYLESLFSLSADTLLSNTKFRSYRKYFFKVIPSNMDKEKIHKINEFLKNIDKREFYALGQQMTQLNLRMRKLHRNSMPITIRVVDLHKEIYDLACSCVEKYLKIIYGITMACGVNPLDYKKIKKIPTYEIKRRLENGNYNYQLLLRPFNTIIWNADKHTGTIKHIAGKRIEFVANEGVKRKTYASFIQLTKELCAVTFLISRYFFAITLNILRSSRE